MILKDEITQKNRPFLIAGPCSAESEEQIFSIAEDLSKLGNVKALRAGIWKPRTRPNSFEGLGATALPWLVSAGKKFNLPVTTEVANKQHVEIALAAGVDILWIGARTTVNPFAVQEIADALRGTQIPVMIKNPINPDIELWLGAFERFEQAGITDLTAIHRGFSIYKHKKYRNVPSWEIPIALMERRPNMPMICDPSHIAGNRDLLLEVSQKAMDLNFEGLMIEAHPNPDKAWSDAAQQVTADGLDEIMKNLILRQKTVGADIATILDEMREKIGSLDDRIFDLLATRMRLSEDVGQFKREQNITILQQEHWEKVIKLRMGKEEEYNLSPSFIRKIIDALHQESIRHQVRVMNK